MCGRYYVDDKMGKEIGRIISRIEAELNLRRQDIFPSQNAITICQRGRSLSAVSMQWGFPQYTGKGLLINARSETALDKSSFRDSLLQRRCVIPAAGFYEWNQAKEKVEFRDTRFPALYMAGIYNNFQGANRFVILTTAANSSVAPVHDRMPLILEPSELHDWVFNDVFMRRALRKTPHPLARRQEYEQQSFLF